MSGLYFYPSVEESVFIAVCDGIDYPPAITDNRIAVLVRFH